MRPWAHGTKIKLAELARIDRSHLYRIIHGQVSPSADVAVRLELACRELGLKLTRFDWMYPGQSKSPLLNVDGEIDADR